jgi:hypothetical protein
MNAMTGPGARPQRKPAFVMYSKLHYAIRIKPAFDELWAVAKKTLPESVRISMSQDYVRTCWLKESDEFKAQVEQQAAELHQEELKAWKASKAVPVASAEQYHE